LPATLIAPLWQRGARGDFRAGGAEAAFGHPPLVPREMRYFKEVVSAHADESVTKWVDFFVSHKSSKPEQTSSHSRRIRNIPICVPILPHERSRRASAELRGPTFAMTARGPTMHAERLIL
jgi:hypothetical protein